MIHDISIDNEDVGFEKIADDSIVFACANPIPNIWPWGAKEAGVRIVATDISDFPNQVNNCLGFAAIFRGVLDAKYVRESLIGADENLGGSTRRAFT